MFHCIYVFISFFTKFSCYNFLNGFLIIYYLSQNIYIKRFKQLKEMHSKGHRLSNQLLGEQTPKKTQFHHTSIACPAPVEQIISLHRKVIQKLQEQIKYLRQYVKYFIGDRDKDNHYQIDTDSSLPVEKDSGKEGYGVGGPGFREVIKQVMAMLEVEEVQHIISKLTGVLQKANKKIQPVFVERIKYKEVAVPVEIIREVIKQVQKQVIVEKIVQVPIFKEKIVYKYAQRPPQTNTIENSTSNSSPCLQSPNQNLSQKQIESQKPPKQQQTISQPQQNNTSQINHKKLSLRIEINEQRHQRIEIKSPSNGDYIRKKQFAMESPKNNQTIDFSYLHLHNQNNVSNGNNFMKSPRFREKNKEEGKNGKYEEGCSNGGNSNNGRDWGYEQGSYEDDKGRDRDRDRDLRNDKNYRSPRYKAKDNYF